MSTVIDDFAKPVPPQSPKGSSGLKTLFVVLGVIIVLGMLACGGLGALLWFGISRAQVAAADEIGKKLGNHPIVLEELGQLQQVTSNLPASLEIAKQRGRTANRQQPEWVFDVVGSKGTGKLIVTLENDSGSGQITAAILETADGRKIDLPLDQISQPSEFDPSSDIDLGEIEVGQ